MGREKTACRSGEGKEASRNLVGREEFSLNGRLILTRCAALQDAKDKLQTSTVRKKGKRGYQRRKFLLKNECVEKGGQLCKSFDGRMRRERSRVSINPEIEKLSV